LFFDFAYSYTANVEKVANDKAIGSVFSMFWELEVGGNIKGFSTDVDFLRILLDALVFNILHFHKHFLAENLLLNGLECHFHCSFFVRQQFATGVLETEFLGKFFKTRESPLERNG